MPCNFGLQSLHISWHATEEFMPNHLKEIREAQGISRYALARALGVSHTTLWRWEKEDAALDRRVLKKLAKQLEVAPSDILPELNLVHVGEGHDHA
jgi:transcriptional regulator with XRE-family HTH domain